MNINRIHKIINELLKILLLILGIIFLLLSLFIETISTNERLVLLFIGLVFIYISKQFNYIVYSKMKDDLLNNITELENKKASLIKDIEKNNDIISNANNDINKILDIKKELNTFEKAKLIMDSDIFELNNKKENLTNEINKLKQEKAILIEDIEQLSQNKPIYIIDKDIYFSIEYVDTIKDGLKFETYFAELLDKLGYYDIKITSASGDFGIDVIACYDDICYGFQCKLYSSEVGNSAVQEAYSGIKHYNCNVAVVVTNNFFTEQAKHQAKETNVILWDRTILSNKLEQANKITFSINKS